MTKFSVTRRQCYNFFLSYQKIVPIFTKLFIFQELTRIELEHLCFLGPEELVHAFAKESSQGSSQSLPTGQFLTKLVLSGITN